jgi:hypothetical protein
MDGALDTRLVAALNASLDSAGDGEADDEVKHDGDGDTVNEKLVSLL